MNSINENCWACYVCMYVFMYASECMSMEVESLSFLVSFVTIVLYKTGGPSRIIHSVYAACVPAKPFADQKYDYGPVMEPRLLGTCAPSTTLGLSGCGIFKEGAVYLSLFDITSIEASDVEL